MRIVELIIDEEEELNGIDAISLVRAPAIESNFIALKALSHQFATQDEEKRIVIGPALIPNKPILRRDNEGEYHVYFSKETVRQAMELYLKRGHQSSATLEHQKPIEGVTLIESWIVEGEYDKSRHYGLDVPKGTWMVTLKVDNDEVWQEYVKEGKVKGFSIEGYFVDKTDTFASDKREFGRDSIYGMDIRLYEKENNVTLKPPREALQIAKEIKKYASYGHDEETYAINIAPALRVSISKELKAFYNEMGKDAPDIYEKGPLYGYFVSERIKDKVRNREAVEPAYYEAKEWFKSRGERASGSIIFNEAVKYVEKFILKNRVKTLSKEEFESFSDYPEAVKNNAKRGIELNEKHGNKCATQTGKVRAQQLADGEPVSLETVKRMKSYLSRAEEYYDEGDTSACGTISYLLWGGKAALRWADSKLKEEMTKELEMVCKEHHD